jgi:hypothetical protein
VDTCQDFHQRTFACAILANQCMHFAREEAKIHTLQGLHAAKLFGDSIEFNNGVRRFRHVLIPLPGRNCKTDYSSITMTNEKKCF